MSSEPVTVHWEDLSKLVSRSIGKTTFFKLAGELGLPSVSTPRGHYLRAESVAILRKHFSQGSQQETLVRWALNSIEPLLFPLPCSIESDSELGPREIEIIKGHSKVFQAELAKLESPEEKIAYGQSALDAGRDLDLMGTNRS